VALWNNKALQNALCKAHNANIQGGVAGAKFYFDNAKRFAAPGFIPNKDDTLMARRKTVGIVETHFEYNNTTFTLVDVVPSVRSGCTASTPSPLSFS
jgi:guanine nucleotide-binding protein subunit alpha